MGQSMQERAQQFSRQRAGTCRSSRTARGSGDEVIDIRRDIVASAVRLSAFATSCTPHAKHSATLCSPRQRKPSPLISAGRVRRLSVRGIDLNTPPSRWTGGTENLDGSAPPCGILRDLLCVSGDVPPANGTRTQMLSQTAMAMSDDKFSHIITESLSFCSPCTDFGQVLPNFHHFGIPNSTNNHFKFSPSSLGF